MQWPKSAVDLTQLFHTHLQVQWMKILNMVHVLGSKIPGNFHQNLVLSYCFFFLWLQHFLCTINEKVKTKRGSVLLTSECCYRLDWIFSWRKHSSQIFHFIMKMNKQIFTKYFLSTCFVSIKWIRNIRC